jgi:benzodiazapine receptor
MMAESPLPTSSNVAAPASKSVATPDNANRAFNKFNFVNIIAYLLNVFVTFAIGTFGLAGRPTNGELSEKYQTIVTPTGLSFSIWGPIFIIQALWVLWQLLPSQRNNLGVTLVGWNYLLVVAFQCGWTVSFSYEVMWLSLLCMYGILFFLVRTVMALNRTYTDKCWKGYLLWQFPFSLHCGWIVAASAVNTNLLPVYYGATAAVQLGVASASLVVLAGVALTWLASYPVDLAIPAVQVWALAGVYLSLEDPDDLLLETFTSSQIEGVQYGVVASAFLVLAAIAVKVVYVCCVQRPKAVAARTSLASSHQAPSDDKGGQSEGTVDVESPIEEAPTATVY